MNFEKALESAKAGNNIFREGWNGSKQYVFVINDGYFLTDVSVEPFFMLYNSQGRFFPWTPSNGDLFAEDWEISGCEIVKEEKQICEKKKKSNITKVKDLELDQSFTFDGIECVIEEFPTRKSVILGNKNPVYGEWETMKVSIKEFKKTAIMACVEHIE